MDLKLVKNIINLISDSDVDEVSIEEGDFKIKVKKRSDSTMQTVQYQMQPQQQQPPATPPQPAAPQAPKSTESAEKPDGEVIKSPIVGTFYEAASPDSDPYVKVGDKVKEGQTLCIVEAMKIMNEIESEFSGTILEIIAENGSPVEFDQPLFIIKKD
mgnify:CR=1 FL=1|tara:strand:+ start:38424 stop:38894 length:471 start_codon:yes stop_codon:yes gene_type:complete